MYMYMFFLVAPIYDVTVDTQSIPTVMTLVGANVSMAIPFYARSTKVLVHWTDNLAKAAPQYTTTKPHGVIIDYNNKVKCFF